MLVACVTRMNCLDFGEYLIPDPIIFLSDFSPLKDWAKLIHSTIIQIVVDVQIKLGGQVWCVTRKNCCEFGEDPNLDWIR